MAFDRPGLRSKLLLGFAGLLLVLLLVSVLAGTVMDYYSRAIHRSYREDYESVVVCQGMKETIEQLDLAAQNSLWSSPVDEGFLASARDQFEQKLQTQRRDATLPGEAPATDGLTALWQEYLEGYQRLTDPSLLPAERRDLYLTTIQPKSLWVRKAAQRLIDMNLAAMLSVPGTAEAAARQAHWAMRTLTISGLALSLLVAVMIGRVVLGPVKLLTKSVREVERGNFDLSVPIRSRDELGALAAAFNTMAERLRAYRRLDHERLVRTERTTQLAIDSLPDPVLVVNSDGRVELSNDVARRLLQVMPGNDIKTSCWDWLRKLWQQISAAGGTTALMDYESTVQLDLDGESHYFLPRTAPILDESGGTIGATVVLADVTGLRRLDEMKNSLLSLVSHELKTPLTSARMVLHLLANEKLGPLAANQAELIVAARDDSDRLHQIVENLLDMSRIESGRALMDLQSIAPDELVRRSTEPLAGMFHSQQVSLVTSLADRLDRVRADATRIGHVFANLLMNSLRHTNPGGSVTIGARQRGKYVEFQVRDTGSGIPRQHLPRVFDKFYRVPGQRGSGSGLGLAIAKDIVEAHGGQIRVNSAEGEGSEFAFTLPVQCITEEASEAPSSQALPE